MVGDLFVFWMNWIWIFYFTDIFQVSVEINQLRTNCFY